MINVTNKLMKAWYTMLNGFISVPVYRVDAPASEEGNYVLLRVESESDNSNNSKFVTNPVIITEVVTKYKVAIKDGDAADIDTEIAQLLFPTVGQLGLPSQAGIQITEVQRLNATYIPEDDGTFRYNRLVTRNRHRVVQLDADNLGPEEITNGAFTTDATGWALGSRWSYDSTNHRIAHSVGTGGDLVQAGALVTNSRYRVSFTMTGTQGSVTVYLGEGTGVVFPAQNADLTFDGTWIGPGTTGGNKIIFNPFSQFDGSIDNVSVKEIL